MQVPHITTNNPTFGYKHELKTLYKKGKIPLTKGFYGEPMDKDSVTLEHLKCVCEGGKTVLDNIVLTSANANQARSNRPLAEVIDYKAMGEYFEVFKDKVFGTINGNDYIQKCMENISKILRG